MKTKNSQTSPSEENADNTNIADELESVNEARLHAKEVNDHSEAEEIDELDSVDRLKAEMEEANKKYLRLYAEFDNYKKRTSKERVELLQTAGKDVISDLLPVLDDLNRALTAMEDTEVAASTKEGITLVANKLKATLQQKGLKEMISINEPFDPDFHEAVTKIPAPNEDMKGKVVDEILKGYLLNDKVLRYAKVVVGS